MSSSYTEFAAVYDELMKDIPYDAYIDYIELASNGVKGKQILDIGCGTGILSAMLAKKGADVTGVDLSKEMLEVAQQRAKSLGLAVKFLNEAMQELEVDRLYDAAIIPIDSLNYVLQPEEVQETFRRIYQALKKDGILLFDVHSTYKTDEIFLESPFVYDDGRVAYIWQTAEADFEHSVCSELAFFVKQGELYRRFDEVHVQRTFPVPAYVTMLEQAGFSIERIFADWEDEPPHDESERIFFQVRK